MFDRQFAVTRHLPDRRFESRLAHGHAQRLDRHLPVLAQDEIGARLFQHQLAGIGQQAGNLIGPGRRQLFKCGQLQLVNRQIHIVAGMLSERGELALYSDRGIINAADDFKRGRLFRRPLRHTR